MKTKTHNKRPRGFTLIEVLVYMAVLVLVASALITTFLSFDTVLIRNKTERVLTEEARTSLEHVLRSIREADSVNVGPSTFNSSPGVLSLIRGATTTRFYTSGGVLMFEQNGSDVGPITSNAVAITGLVFNYQTGTSTDLIRITLTLSASSSAASSTRTFYSSAVLKGTYD